MDKIILNSNMLPGKVGQPGTIEDLKRLSKLLKMDVANFGGKNFEGFPTDIADRIADILDRDCNKDTSTVCVFNDIALEQTYSLLSRGYKLKNIYLVFGKWERHGRKVTASLDMTSFEIVKEYLKNNFKNKFNLLNLSDVYNMGNNNMNKFDLVIANPPYEIGNAVITETMKHCNEAVVLMPISKYKKGNLFKQVKSFELVDAKSFGDAQIGDGLYIAEIDHKFRVLDWDKFELASYDINYKLIYEHINNSKASYTYISLPKLPYKPDPETEFMITMRTVQNGTHKTKDCADYPFNVLCIYDEKNIPIDITYNRCSCAFLKFNTKQEKRNFAYFWYNGELMNSLIKGLKKASGTVYNAIPHIDWSKTDVEYTDEYVLSQMGLKWNENKDGVEKV